VAGAYDAQVTAGQDDLAVRSDPRRVVLLWAWTLLVVLYFTWEIFSYRGLFALAAEWQFVHLGQDLPTFTFGALVFIFSWPVVLILRRNHRAAAAEASVADKDRQDLVAALDSARAYMHFLFGLTMSLAFAMVVALAWTLLLPSASGEPRSVNIAAGNPPEGVAAIEGTVNYGRLASFSRGILFLRRTSIYAPVVPEAGHDQPIRYFLEFLPGERADISNGGSVTHRQGILVRNDLPGGLRRLYLYLGYTPAPHYYVLYASPLTMRWPYYLAAIQLALGALAFLVAALFQRRRVNRLTRSARRRTLRDAPAAGVTA
jgi:hypothetical protein